MPYQKKLRLSSLANSDGNALWWWSGKKNQQWKEISTCLSWEEWYPCIFCTCTVGNSRVRWHRCRLIEKGSWFGFWRRKCSIVGLSSKTDECDFRWCTRESWNIQLGFNSDEEEQTLAHNNTSCKPQARVAIKRCCWGNSEIRRVWKVLRKYFSTCLRILANLKQKQKMLLLH